MKSALSLMAATGAIGAATYWYTLPVDDATDAEDWYEMPDGKLYHKSCIHHHDQEFHLEMQDGGSMVTTDDGSEFLPECEHKPKMKEVKKVSGVDSYYSGWSNYAQQASTKNYSYMKSTWNVPPAPTYDGPGDLSSIYLFNGLEDGGGVRGTSTFIIQPVLQWGKSGCLIDPLLWEKWHLTSYLVAGGRAHCGARIRVYTGESVTGTMTLTDATQNIWKCESKRDKTGQISKYSATVGETKVNAAYLTLELMIFYACSSLPANSGINFTNNSLKYGDAHQTPVTDVGAQWVKELPHTYCDQAVNINKTTGDVEIAYDHTKK